MLPHLYCNMFDSAYSHTLKSCTWYVVTANSQSLYKSTNDIPINIPPGTNFKETMTDMVHNVPIFVRSGIHVSTNRSCLTLLDVAVLSGSAVIRVFRERNARQHFQETNAHNSGAFNASLVRHKIGVEDTHRSCVEDRSSRGIWQIVGDGENQMRSRAFGRDVFKLNATCMLPCPDFFFFFLCSK